VTDALITGSWDQSLRFWDPRAETAEVSSHALPERVYSMDLVNNTLVVAMASRLFHIYDVRKMSEPAQTRESSLKFMTRSLACMADGQGECPSSVRCRLMSNVYVLSSWQGMPLARSKVVLASSTLIRAKKPRTKNMHSSVTARRLTMSTTSGQSTHSLSTPCQFTLHL
jgi:hypothetical protein